GTAPRRRRPGRWAAPGRWRGRRRGRARARLLLLGLDEEVAGHLEVQRRAELGAVHRVDAGPVGDEGDVLLLAGLERQLDVVRADGEAVGRVERLFEVRDVQVDRLALLHLDDVGREVAADRRHVDVDAVAGALDALLAALDRERVLGHGLGIRAGRVDVERLDLVGLDHLRVVRLADGDRQVVDDLHLFATE